MAWSPTPIDVDVNALDSLVGDLSNESVIAAHQGKVSVPPCAYRSRVPVGIHARASLNADRDCSSPPFVRAPDSPHRSCTRNRLNGSLGLDTP